MMVFALLFTQFAAAAEDWKGESPKHEMTAGGMAGLGILGGSAGVAIMGSVAKKIVNRGFVSDINDQVFVEVAAGPLFISGSTVFVYSTHLRWDFYRDEVLAPYAIGGLGGHVTGAALGSTWALFPRFGAGVLWKVAQMFSVRAEVSHEFTGAGVQVAF